MILYHQTKVRFLGSIQAKGLIARKPDEWKGLVEPILSLETPIIWFTDTIREKGSYLHPTKCLLQVNSSRLDGNKLKALPFPEGWWVYADNIEPSFVELVPYQRYRKSKPKWWMSVNLNKDIVLGPYTFGKSQAALNLTGNILPKQEPRVAKKAQKLLGSQMRALKNLMVIPDKNVREASLIMWHLRFREKVDKLPELVKTHVLCVETGLYRQLISESQKSGK